MEKTLYCKRCKQRQPHIVLSDGWKECRCGKTTVPRSCRNKSYKPLTEKERDIVQRKIQTRLRELQ